MYSEQQFNIILKQKGYVDVWVDWYPTAFTVDTTLMKFYSYSEYIKYNRKN